jgi:hypothetical protein
MRARCINESFNFEQDLFEKITTIIEKEQKKEENYLAWENASDKHGNHIKEFVFSFPNGISEKIISKINSFIRGYRIKNFDKIDPFEWIWDGKRYLIISFFI